MRKIKHSLLITSLVATSTLHSISLEEAIKDVDISGSLRYRYDTFIQRKSKDYSDAQLHKFNASLSTKIKLSEGLSAVGTLHYNADDEGDGGFGEVGTNTKLPLMLEEAYLRYDSDEIYATSIILGRAKLNTIWTDNDNLGGSVGMKAQLINNALSGITLTAFAVDSVNDDGDFAGANLGANLEELNAEATNPFIANKFNTLKDAIFAQNLYGGAILLDYSENIGITGQLWYGYMNNRLSMVAVDLAYNLAFTDFANFTLQAQYLGNKPVGFFKGTQMTAKGVDFGSASLYTVATGIEISGFDASVGYSTYGKKDKFSVNVLEDMGDIITAGEEIQNLDGVGLHGSKGKNQIIFGGLGYTFADIVRLGVDYAYGTSKFAKVENENTKNINQEIVGRLEYHHSDKLTFSSFYSFITQKPNLGQTSKYDNIRFEARYDF